ncbi:lipopolysaccharide transport periplasmic protein LptA [Deltaproteobacteria bacterium Smac51]|nr:lipopolysaccharide transport periplasmic protein LptA [Deltaproteobacteria bacterium Smac51]
MRLKAAPICYLTDTGETVKSDQTNLIPAHDQPALNKRRAVRVSVPQTNHNSSQPPAKSGGLRYVAAALVAAALLWSQPSEAQLRPGGAGDSRGPIAISADTLEADDPGGLVTFKGAVVARQGQMTLTCDLMKVFYNASSQAQAAEAASAENRQIDRVECNGNVKIVEGERLAVGQKAVYLAQALPRRIVLTGEARIWQGQDSLTGHQVTYYLDDNRSLVEGGGRRDRVRAVYHQEDGQK